MTQLVSPLISSCVLQNKRPSPWHFISNRMIKFPKISNPIVQTSSWRDSFWNTELRFLLLMNTYQLALLFSTGCQGMWLICMFCSSTYFTVSLTFFYCLITVKCLLSLCDDWILSWLLCQCVLSNELDPSIKMQIKLSMKNRSDGKQWKLNTLLK